MALSLQNVADDVSFHTRKYIDGTSGSGADFNLLVRWIDQVHKDLLHEGVFAHALRKRATITSVAGTFSYVLTGTTDLRRVDAVFNRPNLNFLSPLDDLFPPTNIADPRNLEKGARPPMADFVSSAGAPRFYRMETVVTAGTPAHTLWIFPTPLSADSAGVVDVFYTRLITTVSGAATNLEVGDDGRGAMMAGVLALAYDYLHRSSKSAAWKQQYEALKLGERIK